MPAPNLDPKVRFLERKQEAAIIRDVTASNAFATAADAAMLQLIKDLPETYDQTTAAAYYHVVVGARTFRRRLETIGDPPTPVPTRRTNDNLNHES